jgi:subtilase family serine protease
MITHVPVDLAPGESYIGCFNGYTWTYTPPSDDITVCADNNETIVELDETNNCLTNIWACGDVNGDGKVTMSDVRKVFNRYLDSGYELNCCCRGVG